MACKVKIVLYAEIPDDLTDHIPDLVKLAREGVEQLPQLQRPEYGLFGATKNAIKGAYASLYVSVPLNAKLHGDRIPLTDEAAHAADQPWRKSRRARRGEAV